MPAWDNSTRRSRLPQDWARRRKWVLQRDKHRCQWTDSGRICGQPATDVDHITPGDDHSPTNLRSLCAYHHARKSSAEGNAAKAKRRNEIRQRFRRTEKHPGLID